MNMRSKLVAEFCGTFLLVFCGTGAIVVDQEFSGAVSQVGIAFTFGLTVMALIYLLGDISGAHFNPAVTTALAAAGRFPLAHWAPYLLAQVSGALGASVLLRGLFPANAALGGTQPSGPAWQSCLLEAILTAFLILAILSVSREARAKEIVAGIAVGGVITLEAMWAGPVSGASMNPARSLAPALVTQQMQHLWIYFVGPVLGALLAIPVFNFIYSSQKEVLP